MIWMIPQTFDDHIIDFEAILIFFTGAGCTTCQDFLPSYQDTARDLFMWEPHISMGESRLSLWGDMTNDKVFHVAYFGL